MAKETKPKDKEEAAKVEPAADQPKAKAKGKLPGWIWYVVYGIAGVALIGAVAFGTLLMMGGKKTAEVAPTEGATAQQHASADSTSHVAAPADSMADSLAKPEDSALLSEAEIEKMLQSVEALDQPTAEDLAAAEGDSLTAQERDSAAAPELFKEEKEKLAARETEINRRQKDLEVREQKLAQQLIKLEQASSQKIIDLAKLYDGMQPQAVAELLANLDDTTVVSIIPRMKPKVASQVLQLMPPPRAASISKQIITLAKD